MRSAALLWVLLLAWAWTTPAAWSAPPGLYRCPKPDGSASFQDRPCPGRGGSRLDAAGVDDEAALRRWLRSQQRAPRVATGTGGRPLQALPGGALPVALMTACSTRFYDCANGDGVRMQRCLEQVPVCSASRTTRCCPTVALERFRAARAGGATPAQATRRALLGEE